MGIIKQYFNLLPEVKKIVKDKLGQIENDDEKAQLEKDLNSIKALSKVIK